MNCLFQLKFLIVICSRAFKNYVLLIHQKVQSTKALTSVVLTECYNNAIIPKLSPGFKRFKNYGTIAVP